MPSSYNKKSSTDEDYQPPDPKDQVTRGFETPLSSPAVDQGSNVRRSSRANKGVPRPIFDPSDLPSPSNVIRPKYRKPSVPESDSEEEEEDQVKKPLKKRGPKPRLSKEGSSTTKSKATDSSNKNKTTRKTSSTGESESSGESESLIESKAGSPTYTNNEESSESPQEANRDESFSDEDDLPLTNFKPPPSVKDSPKKSPNLELSPLKSSPYKFEHRRQHQEQKKKEIVDLVNDRGDHNQLSSSKGDKLPCSCRKTPTDRFLVLCDKCESWLNGCCIGLSSQRAKNIEEKGEIYICPECSPAQRKLSNSTDMPRDFDKAKSFSMKGYALKGTITNPSSLSQDERAAASEKTRVKFFRIPKKGGDGPPDEPTLQPSPTKPPPSSAASNSAAAAPRRKCTVSTCNKDALPGAVYCSNKCILEHARLQCLKQPTPSSSSTSKMIKPKYSVLNKDKDREEKSSQHHQQQHNQKPHIPSQSTELPQPQRKRKKEKGPLLVRSRKTGEVVGQVILKKHSQHQIITPPSQPPLPRKKNLKRSSPSPHRRESQSSSSSNTTSSSSSNYSPHVKTKKVARKRSANSSAESSSENDKPLSKMPGVFDFMNRHMMKKNIGRVQMPQVTPIPTYIKSKENQKMLEKRRSSKGGEMSAYAASKSKKAKLSFEEQLQNTAQKKSMKLPKIEKIKKVKASHKSTSDVTKVSPAPPKPVSQFYSSATSSSSINHDSIKTFKPSKDDSVRINVRKTLLDVLKNRSSNSEELRMHPDSIKKLTDKIEESLFKHFGSTNTKYKTKFRSIAFNLKDEKNHGLWRKVIIGEVSSGELVQMSSEQMASKKLFEWRQQNLVEELDIIKKQEKERANIRPVAKITHKGEIAIAEDLSDMVQNVTSTSNNEAVSVRKNSETNEGESNGADVNKLDTTSEHKNHLFDLHCSICTGGMKEEEFEQQSDQQTTNTKVKSSSSIILSTEAQNNINNNEVIKTSIVDKLENESATILFNDKLSVDDKIGEVPEDDPALNMPDSPTINYPDSPINAPQSPESDPVKLDYGNDAEDIQEAAASRSKSKNSLIWCGSVNMPELPSFTANVYPVCGDCSDLDVNLPPTLEMGGRIMHQVAWKYLKDVKTTRTKQISIVRFHAAYTTESSAYVHMMSYFNKRARFGVLGNQDRHTVKDMYLIPLLESEQIPEELVLLTDGEIVDALADRPHSIIIGVVVRNKSKRIFAPVTSPSVRTSPDIIREVTSPNINDQLPSSPVVNTTTNNQVLDLIENIRAASSVKTPNVQEQYSPTKSSGITVNHASGYIPASKSTTEDDEYDPEYQQEYDPLTSTFGDNKADVEDKEEEEEEEETPYDPEIDHERIALLNQIKREIDLKAAKLAEMNQKLEEEEEKEQNLENEQDNEVIHIAEESVASDAQPLENSSSSASNDTAVGGNPLQTILSALKLPTMAVAPPSVVDSSPPQLPDSTTKSDPEENPTDDARQQIPIVTSQTRGSTNNEDDNDITKPSPLHPPPPPPVVPSTSTSSNNHPPTVDSKLNLSRDGDMRSRHHHQRSDRRHHHKSSSNSHKRPRSRSPHRRHHHRSSSSSSSHRSRHHHSSSSSSHYRNDHRHY